MNGKAITGIVCICLGLIGGYGLALLVGSMAPEPKHRSFAQCIVDEYRGLPTDAALAVVAACREQFPNGKINLPTENKRVLSDEEAGVKVPKLSPKLPDDLVTPAE
jgi:hypothetical protein